MKPSFNIGDSTVISHIFYVTAYFQKQNVSPAAAAKYFFPPLLSNSVNSQPILPLYRTVNSSFMLVLYFLMYDCDKATNILWVACAK